MKKFAILALLLMPVAGMAEEQGISGLTAHDIIDNRAALELSPRMKHRLLSDMREQLAATRAIIGLLAQDKFARASSTARAKLAMSEELKQVYDAANNEDFRILGLAANASADELAKMLQTKDLKKSLLALRKTLGYCQECHKKFRQ
ncbi:MAG: cytochrome C [Pseudomonadota bacterium]